MAPYEDFLNGIITIGIGLAALASLLTIFKADEHFNQGDRIDFRGIVLMSLLLCVGGITPLLLVTVITDSVVMWQVLSIGYFVLVGGILLDLQLSINRGDYIVYTRLSLPLRVVTGLVAVVVLPNVFIWRSADPYMLGMYWAMFATIGRFYIFLMGVIDHHDEA
jgi:hypothetical protein